MDLTFYLLAFALIVIFLGIFFVIRIVLQVTNIPIVRARMELRDRIELPEHLQTLFSAAEQQLHALGFRYSHCQLVDESSEELTSQRWLLCYRHPEYRCGATISSALRPGQNNPYLIEFSAYDHSGKLLSTVNGFAHYLIRDLPDYILFDGYHTELEQQWQMHLDAMKQYIRQPLLLSPPGVLAASKRFHQRYLDYLSANGWIEAVSENRYRFRIWPGLKYALQIIRGERRVAKMLRQRADSVTEMQTTDAQIAADVDAYQLISERSQIHSLGWLAKTVLFIASVILFCAVFGIVLSWQTVLIILAVLLFHESGHLLAMRWFGYRDLQILFIPALGAVATGKDDHVKIYQKVIVYLLGPLPGLIVGYALFLWYQQAPGPLLLEIVVIILVVNYFNLLPIMPLDGGQTLNLLLFSRYPRAQVLFLLFSIILLGVLSWYLEAIILWLLIILLTAAFFSQWHDANVLVRLRQQARHLMQSSANNEKPLLTAIFRLLREPDYQQLPLNRKYQLARYLLKNFSVPRVSGLTIAISLTVYLSALIIPVTVFTSDQALSSLATAGTQTFQEPDWAQKLAAAENNGQRWQIAIEAGDWYYEIEDISAAQNYYQQAGDIAENFPKDDIRSATVLYKQGLAADNNQSARELFQQALQKQQQLLDKNHPDIADTLTAMVWTYDDFSQQKQQLERALMIYQQAGDQINSQQSLRTLAWLAEQNGEKDQAETYWLQALEQSEHRNRNDSQAGEDVYWTNTNLSNLADFYLRYADYDKALLILKRLTYLLQHSRQDYVELLHAQALSQLGWVYLLQQDIDNAAVCFEQARQAYQSPVYYTEFDPGLLPLLLDSVYVSLKQDKTQPPEALIQQIQILLEQLSYGGIEQYQEHLRAVLSRQENSSRWPLIRQAAHLEAIEAILNR